MILITGATGNVGSELVHILSGKNVPLRVLARNAEKVAHFDAKVERVIGDYKDPKVLEQALKGVDKLFLFPLITERDHSSNQLLIDHAKKAGVKHIVMLSSMGAETEQNEIGVLHREKEKVVENSGMSWTFVRPGAFMTNTFQWLPMIQNTGKVFSPTGEGKVAPISQRDIAEVLAVALTAAGHEDKIYVLTGPELLNSREQLAIISKASGKDIDYVDIPVSKAAEEFRKTGAPEFLVNALSQMWQQVREGKGAVQTGEVERLTGHKGETFASWAERHKEAFCGPSLAVH